MILHPIFIPEPLARAYDARRVDGGQYKTLDAYIANVLEHVNECEKLVAEQRETINGLRVEMAALRKRAGIGAGWAAETIAQAVTQ